MGRPGPEPDRHEWFRYPDHGLADVPFERARRAHRGDPSRRTARRRHHVRPRRRSPGIPITSRSARRRRRRSTASGPRARTGFRRLIHVAHPAVADGHVEREADRAGPRADGPDAAVSAARGARRVDRVLASTPSSVAHSIVAALREHRTQASDLDALLSDEEQLEAAATRARARSRGRRGSRATAVVTDVFEGSADRATVRDRLVGMDIEIRTITEDEFEECLRSLELSFSGAVTAGGHGARTAGRSSWIGGTRRSTTAGSSAERRPRATGSRCRAAHRCRRRA